MPPNQEFRFAHRQLPTVNVVAFSESGMQRSFRALLDTGADMTILDERKRTGYLGRTESLA